LAEELIDAGRCGLDVQILVQRPSNQFIKGRVIELLPPGSVDQFGRGVIGDRPR